MRRWPTHRLHGNAEVEAGMGLLTGGVISTVARVPTGRRCRCGADGVVREELLGSAELAVGSGNNLVRLPVSRSGDSRQCENAANTHMKHSKP
jgi:hypothetical protein